MLKHCDASNTNFLPLHFYGCDSKDMVLDYYFRQKKTIINQKKKVRMVPFL